MTTQTEIASDANEFKELDGIKNELDMLTKRTTKDFENFQRLCNDRELIKGLDKLYDVSCEMVFGDERKEFESLNISYQLNKILEKYPNLWLKITGDLKLPLGETKFSNLTTQQKINYSILHEAIYGKNLLYKKNPNSEDIDRRIRYISGSYNNRINNKFKNKNIGNFLQLEKTLTEDFHLTQTEAGKVKEYLKTIKTHPEFIGQMGIIESGNTGGYIVVAILALALGAIGMHYIDNIGAINPETTNYVGDTVIEEPEAILWLLTQKSGFSTTGSIRKKMFQESEENNIIELGKNWLKRGINLFETKELTMEMVGDLALKYDLEGSSLTVNHTTGEAVLKVKKPDIIVLDSKAEITNSNGEVFELQAFRNAELELENNLKKQAIQEAKNNPRFYETMKQQTEEDLTELFKEIQPYGVDVKSVRVEYIESLQIPSQEVPRR